jgi:hypothetical protein
MLALEHPSCGSAQMAMVVAIGIRCPLGDELDQAGVPVNVCDRHRVVDWVIESRASLEIVPLETV